MTPMNRLLIPIILILMLMGFGCTQNNGYIGPVFGSWSLVSISRDGHQLPLNGETVFSFQNEVVQVELIKSEFERVLRYGNFSISDDVMTMKFLSGPDPEHDGYEFIMPTWLYFPVGEMPLRFDVRKLSGKAMELAIDNDGDVYLYEFSKTW